MQNTLTYQKTLTHNHISNHDLGPGAVLKPRIGVRPPEIRWGCSRSWASIVQDPQI